MKRVITYSPSGVLDKNIESYPFSGEFEKLIGEPDVRFSTIIRGQAKAGKSTYLLLLAQYASQWGKVLYISGEEGVKSKSLQSRIERCGVTSPKVRFAQRITVEQLELLVKNARPRFVIVDSANIIGLTFNDFERLKTMYAKRKISWHIVLQMGGNIERWRHEADVLIELSNGLATAQGRFRPEGKMRIFAPAGMQQTLFNH